MSNTFNEINSLEILAVLDAGGISYQKDSGSPYMYTICKPNGELDTSFKVNTAKNIATDFGGSDIKGGPFDIVGRLILGVDTQSNSGKVETLKWFVDKGLVKDQQVKKAFTKNYNKADLLENINSLRLGGYKEEVGRWLRTRGVGFDFITKNQLLIGEIFRDIGFYDNLYCTEFESFRKPDGEWENREGDEPKNVPVLLFPCMDIDGSTIGIKIRRVDGKTIWGKKSFAVGKTGLLWWGNLKGLKTTIVCEGEADGIILRLLGYKGVVANLGGVQSHRLKLKSLLYEIPTVLCLYDGDDAGTLGKAELMKSMGRVIYQIDMPIRQDPSGRVISDINDLYEVGYDNKKKWDEVFEGMYEVGGASDGAKKNSHRYAFLDEPLEFYDTTYRRVQNDNKVASSMGLTVKELHKLVHDNIIQKYINTCYWYGGKKGYLNTMNEDVIVNNPGDAEPILHPHIEMLIKNIAGGKNTLNNKKNEEWIYKAILFKLTHINSAAIPALILFGSGRSGKGTFINLLSKIFGDDNTQKNLKQKDLESGFDSYSGGKLIVEFQEVSSGNTFQDKKVVDRIKSMVGEKTMSVRKLYQNTSEVENLAWFHFSSNHPIPIQLDSKQSGNMRFSVIKTGNALPSEEAFTMNTMTFEDKEVIKQFIAWLYETYPDVPALKSLKPVDNTEKRDLEDMCEGVGVQFFEWFEQEYPNIWRLSNKQMETLKQIYMEKECIKYNDKRFDKKNFDQSIMGKYMKKKVSIKGKSIGGYYIEKTKFQEEQIKKQLSEGGGPLNRSMGEFTDEQWRKILREYGIVMLNT